MEVTALKMARVASGIKQWRLASIVGIRASDLSNMEAGRLRVPANLRHKLADVLEKPVNAIFPEYQESA